MQNKSPEDDFDLGYRGAPDEIELRAMSYVRLCSEIDDATVGTTKFMLLETEKLRRDSVQIAEPAKAKPGRAGEKTPDPGGDVVPPKPHWWKQPIGIIGIGLVIAALGSLLNHVFKTNFGLNP